MSDCSAAPWTVACQASLSTGFPRQEYWSGLSFASPGDLPSSETENKQNLHKEKNGMTLSQSISSMAVKGVEVVAKKIMLSLFKIVEALLLFSY